MPNITDSITSYVKGILGNVPQQASPGSSSTDASTRRPGSANSHAATHDDDDEIEEVLAPAAQSVKKRTGHAAAEAEGIAVARQPLRKPGSASAEAKRLTGHYDTPTTATAITVPQYDSDGREQPVPHGKMSKFKPRNTLGDARHASRPGGSMLGTDFMRKNQGQIKKRDRRALSVTASAGGNVIRERESYDGHENGMENDAERRIKKQKTHHGMTGTGPPSSSTVDLTENDGNNGRLDSSSGGADGWRYARHSTTSLATSAGNILELSAIKQIDRTLNGRPKKPRKPKDHSRSSQASSQAPSVADLCGNGDAGRNTGARETPLTEEDGVTVLHSAGGPRRRIDQSGTKPPIDLTKGLDKIRKSTAGSETAGVPSVLKHGSTPRQDPGRAERTNRMDESRVNVLPQDPNLHSEGILASQQDNDIRRNFQRDTAPSEPSRPKAKDKMMTQSATPGLSKLSPAVNGADSDDALQGGNTIVGPHGTPFAKQSKHTPRGSHSVAMLSGTSKDYAQPEVTEADTRPHQNAPKQHLSRSIVRVTAFYAESCILSSGGGVELRYHAQDGLELFHDNLPVLILGKQKVLSLGRNEVHRVIHSSKGSRVYLKGSKTDVSNGGICIAFEDHEGVEAFIRLIQLTAGDQIKVEDMHNSDQFNKTFSHQSFLLVQAAKVALGRTSSTAALEQARSRGGLGEAGHGDDEEIQYESEQPPRGSLRRGMHGQKSDLREPERTPRVGRSPAASPYFTTEATRKSSRQTKWVNQHAPSPSPERWTKTHNPKRWSHPVLYPPQGVKRVTVEFGDLERLDEGEFLNDNIISFALRQIEESMPSGLKEDVHFFNSFFYTSLVIKNGRKELNYDAVKRWTKKKDIFTIPYVVVPICIDLHWFLAIICNLHHLPRRLAESNEEIEASGPNALIDETELAEIGDSIEVAHNTTQTGAPKDDMEGTHQPSRPDDGRKVPHGDVYEFDNGGLVVETTTAREGAADGGNRTSGVDGSPHIAPGKRPKSKKKAVPQPRKYDADMPAIVTFDSFGAAHTAEGRNLKEYLIAEANDKRGMKFMREDVQGVTAKGLPEQSNFCDCGVYLIAYAEQFAKNPRAFITKALAKELDQQADFASFNPSAKRAEIRDRLMELHTEQENERQAKKRLKKAGSQIASKLPEAESVPPTKPTSAAAVLREEEPRTSADTPTATLAKVPSPAKVTRSAVSWAPIASTLQQPETQPRVSADAEELEYEPARPLIQPPQPAPKEQGQHGQASSDDSSSEDEADEMLDKVDDQGTGAFDGAAAQTFDLLSGIDAYAKRRSLSPLAPTRTVTGTEGESNRRNLPSSPLDRMEDTADRAAEIAHSQEAMPVSHFAEVGSGKHTIFNH